MLRLLLRTTIDRSGSIGPAYCLCTKSGGSKKHMEQIVKEKTPKGKLDDKDADSGRHRDAEKEPLQKWPGGVNPKTGERGGPAGPEPTRYGDWERKGRVTDF
uniref:Succinate dehydrogenase assembly factor 4, mitochondrial n=1 Tax=Plectus sambesii TaxID=2011161 RepID=A0A914WD96_9BILA